MLNCKTRKCIFLYIKKENREEKNIQVKPQALRPWIQDWKGSIERKVQKNLKINSEKKLMSDKIEKKILENNFIYQSQLMLTFKTYKD